MRADRIRCLRCEAPLPAIADQSPATQAGPAAAGSRVLRLPGRPKRGVVTAAVALLAAAIVAAFASHPSRRAADAVKDGGKVPRPSSAPAAPGSSGSIDRQPAVPAPEPVTALDEVRLGGASLATGDLPASRARFEEALEKRPDDPEALNGLGLALERQGQLAEAHAQFQRAVALSPDAWAYHFNLAHTSAALNQWDDAIAGYRDAARLFPGDYATEFNLAMALHKKGDDQAAIPEFEKAIELAPSESSFHVALAIALEKLGRVPEARREYQRYLDLEPSAGDAAKIRQHLDALAAPASQTPAAPMPAKPDSAS
jgi:Flp pilus assembly protein TadD